jgi:hypothetical protein
MTSSPVPPIPFPDKDADRDDDATSAAADRRASYGEESDAESEAPVDESFGEEPLLGQPLEGAELDQETSAEADYKASKGE